MNARSGPGRFALALCLAWVRLYMLGLPPAGRRDRLDLIASDLWEQLQDSGQPAILCALDLMRRSVAGAPSDLAWRLTAGRSHKPGLPVAVEPRRTPMTERQRFVVLTLLCAFSLALLAVTILRPTEHSLAYASGALVLLALAGWALEIREDDEAGASLWPPLLAAGVASTGAGIVLRWEYAGLAVAAPLALVTARAWWKAMAPREAAERAPVLAVSSAVLSAQAAAGAAIAFELPAGRQVPRRSVILAGLWVGLGTSVAAFAASVVDFLWERNPPVFGGVVDAGPVDRFPPGTKTRVPAGKFWLVNLTAEQGGPGFLALWQKCPHLGCTVPWEENFSFTDPASGEKKKGWFRCPCHQSTYNDAGVRVYGPAPRSMDRMALSVNPDTGRIQVDTGAIARGTPDNARFAVSPPVA